MLLEAGLCIALHSHGPVALAGARTWRGSAGRNQPSPLAMRPSVAAPRRRNGRPPAAGLLQAVEDPSRGR